MRANSFIIEHPEWQSSNQKYITGFISLCFWILWFYLWIPVLGFIGWKFGFRATQYEMFTAAGSKDVLHFLEHFSLAVFLAGSVLIAWGTFNIQRFKGARERRQKSRDVTDIEQALHYSVDPDSLPVWKNSQFIEIEHGHFRAYNRYFHDKHVDHTTIEPAPCADDKLQRVGDDQTTLVR